MGDLNDAVAYVKENKFSLAFLAIVALFLLGKHWVNEDVKAGLVAPRGHYKVASQ